MDDALQLRTISTVAERLEVCTGTVRNLISRGELASLKVGASRRVPESEIAAYIERRLAAAGTE